jgi:TolB-like protein/Tfp pilus assembly protein PilF
LIDSLNSALGSDYRVLKQIGKGGMSTVYLAEDVKLERKVVVKVFSAELIGELPIGRFNREVMLVANLQHPHIVGVISSGEVGGLPYFIMPYVEGMSLSHRLAEQSPLPIAEAVSILREIARACSYAHEQGIVHRDIKPDNILLSDGVAMLADFGVAKALSTDGDAAKSGADSTQTAVGVSLGTPRYIAPEQAAADPATDHRADIYSLGATAYEMLSGRPPFDYLMSHELIAAHISETPKQLSDLRKDIPWDLEQLVMKCLEKNPNARPQNAKELVDWLSISGVVSQQTGRIASGRRKKVKRKVAAWGVVAAVAATAWWWPAGLMNVFVGPDVAERNSLAVLPFVNTGAGDEYFADGMTDELTIALATVPGLKVASRTASFAFRGTTAPVSEIGGSLNVGTILEGTVRLSGSRVRLTAQLVDVADGLSLWSQTFDRELDDIFQVQEDVARAIVEALRERVGGMEPPETMVRRGTENLEAYDQYIRASYLLRQRGEEQLQTALRLFREASAADPNYAEAYAGIADVLGLLPLYSAALLDSVLPMALNAANTAVEMAPDLATAHASLGNLLNADWRWNEAADEFRRAIEIDSLLPSAQQWLGENLLLNGRLDAALVHLENATRADPMSPIAASLRGVALALAGDASGANTWAQRGLELGPGVPVTHFFAGAIAIYSGDLETARSELETASAQSTIPAVTGFLGYAYARLGLEAEARELLAALDSEAPNVAGAKAKIHLGLGELDQALEQLEVAARKHDAFFGSEPTLSPIFDSVRENPRFKAILFTVGLNGN